MIDGVDSTASCTNLPIHMYIGSRENYICELHNAHWYHLHMTSQLLRRTTNDSEITRAASMIDPKELKRLDDPNADAFEPWSMTVPQVIHELKGDEKVGLREEQILFLQARYGQNLLDEGDSVSIKKILISQVCNAMVLVLAIAMVISLAIRDWISGGVIGAVVVINVVVGFYQEYNAAKTMASLKSLSAPTATVVRDGGESVIPAMNLVPGDLIRLKAGDTVAADCRIVDCINFETLEAHLTGESLPIPKDPELVLENNAPVGDRVNMAFASSVVSKGRAIAIVTTIGMSTEIGKIAKILAESESGPKTLRKVNQGCIRKRRLPWLYVKLLFEYVANFLGVVEGTPLQKLMSWLAIWLFCVAVIVAIVVMAAQKFDVTREVAIYAVVAAIAMIPASMVVVLTITMAIGTKAMSERHVMIRKLNSLEALGCVNDICSDKTGTLTQGKMIVRRAWIPSYGMLNVTDANEPYDPTIGNTSVDVNGKIGKVDEHVLKDERFERLIQTASMANTASVHNVNGVWKVTGDPTEIAIQVFVTRLNFSRDHWTTKNADGQAIMQLVAEMPFDSTIKRMSVVYKHNGSGKFNMYTKGAVERILELCNSWYGTVSSDTKEQPFEDKDKKVVLAMVNQFAEDGLRVLAFAVRPVLIEEATTTDWKTVNRDDVERNLTFVGLMGIYDPPRKESAPAVAIAHRAGINVHMLTGDHPATATAIAKQVGILPAHVETLPQSVRDSMTMTASQFDALSDEQIDRLPVLPLVIARCAPQTKVRMIEALHRRKAFTAMTGDGINDSPSLKRADVGIAMGLSGSDVAKEASDIVLSDDNFASILNAVEEGRRMTENIQKFVLHLLAGNVSQVIFLLVGLGFKDNDWFSVFPMSPVEVLWIIMITSSFPAMGLGQERASPDIMLRKPKIPRRAVFSSEVIIDMLLYGLVLAIVCTVSFVGLIYGHGNGIDRLGHDCNEKYRDVCYWVYRTRSVTFVQMTWSLLFLAWEVVDMRASIFNFRSRPGKPFMSTIRNIYQNKLLFWSVIIGFATVFPVVYIPVINKSVFMHKPMKWEWAVAIAGVIVFTVCIEFWKFNKRVFFRRRRSQGSTKDLDVAKFLGTNTDSDRQSV